MTVNLIEKFKDILYVKSTSDELIAIHNDKDSLAKAVMYYGSKDEDIIVTNFIGEVALKSIGTVARMYAENVVGASTGEFLDVLCGMRMHNEVPRLDSFRLSLDEEEMLSGLLFV